MCVRSCFMVLHHPFCKSLRKLPFILLLLPPLLPLFLRPSSVSWHTMPSNQYLPNRAFCSVHHYTLHLYSSPFIHCSTSGLNSTLHEQVLGDAMGCQAYSWKDRCRSSRYCAVWNRVSSSAVLPIDLNIMIDIAWISLPVSPNSDSTCEMLDCLELVDKRTQWKASRQLCQSFVQCILTQVTERWRTFYFTNARWQCRGESLSTISRTPNTTKYINPDLLSLITSKHTSLTWFNNVEKVVYVENDSMLQVLMMLSCLISTTNGSIYLGLLFMSDLILSQAGSSGYVSGGTTQIHDSYFHIISRMSKRKVAVRIQSIHFND